MPGTSAAQADVPVGGRLLANDAGVAPGLRLDVSGCLVVAVPGVPVEMRHIVERHVLPELAGTARPLRRQELRVALLGEPDVAERLQPLESTLPPSVSIAYLASPGEVLVKFASRAEDVEPYAAAAHRLLGDVVSGRGDETLTRTVLRLLGEAGSTVATAESLTGGLVAAALTEVPGSSAHVRGGVVAYATDAKRDVLGVEGALLVERGAVDPDVALAMARRARTVLGASYGVATTGVAGPDHQDGRPVGTLHVAVAGPAGERVVTTSLRGDRTAVRTASVAWALDLLRRALLELPDPPNTPPPSGANAERPSVSLR